MPADGTGTGIRPRSATRRAAQATQWQPEGWSTTFILHSRIFLSTKHCRQNEGSSVPGFGGSGVERTVSATRARVAFRPGRKIAEKAAREFGRPGPAANRCRAGPAQASRSNPSGVNSTQARTRGDCPRIGTYPGILSGPSARRFTSLRSATRLGPPLSCFAPSGSSSFPAGQSRNSVLRSVGGTSKSRFRTGSGQVPGGSISGFGTPGTACRMRGLARVICGCRLPIGGLDGGSGSSSALTPGARFRTRWGTWDGDVPILVEIQ